MRWVALLAVLCAGALLYRARAEEARPPAPVTPTRADAARLPPELRSVLVRAPDPATILRSSGALPGLGMIRRLVRHGDAPPEPGTVPFADIGTPRQLRQVRRDVRRDLAALNRLSDGRGTSPQAAARTLAGVYSAPILTALGLDGRRAFAGRV